MKLGEVKRTKKAVKEIKRNITGFSMRSLGSKKKIQAKKEMIEEEEQKACQGTCATVWLGTGL